MQSDFSTDELEMVRLRPLRPETSTPPSEEELVNAVEKMKCGKAGRGGRGGSGILPEMLKAVCYEDEFTGLLKEPVEDVSRQSDVPAN